MNLFGTYFSSVLTWILSFSSKSNGNTDEVKSVVLNILPSWSPVTDAVNFNGLKNYLKKKMNITATTVTPVSFNSYKLAHLLVMVIGWFLV